MKKSPDVEAFMEKLDHPFKAEVQTIRQMIKGVNKEIEEEIKWNAPSFSYRGEYLLTFNLWEKKRIHLVFHNPEIGNVKSPLLEGKYDHRRMTYFSGLDDIVAKRFAFEKVLKELIRLQKRNGSADDLPKIGAPAQRALAAAGVKQLKDLVKFREEEVKQWHGIGPNALGKLRQALREKGLSFKS